MNRKTANNESLLRVCFDTNIFISAFLFAGKPAHIFDLAVDGEINLITSPLVLAEVAKVLQTKFSWEPKDIKNQLKIISDVALLVIPKRKISMLNYDPDNRILEAALEGKVDYLVTGDKKHLLQLGEFRGVKIVTPAEFLQVVD